MRIALPAQPCALRLAAHHGSASARVLHGLAPPASANAPPATSPVASAGAPSVLAASKPSPNVSTAPASAGSALSAEAQHEVIGPVPTGLPSSPSVSCADGSLLASTAEFAPALPCLSQRPGPWAGRYEGRTAQRAHPRASLRGRSTRAPLSPLPERWANCPK